MSCVSSRTPSEILFRQINIKATFPKSNVSNVQTGTCNVSLLIVNKHNVPTLDTWRFSIVLNQEMGILRKCVCHARGRQHEPTEKFRYNL